MQTSILSSLKKQTLKPSAISVVESTRPLTAILLLPSLLFLSLLSHPSSNVLAQSTQIPTQRALLPSTVIITGTVPDAATRARLVARLESLYGPGSVQDKLIVGDVQAPAGWTEHVLTLLSPDIQKIHQGKLTVSGQRIAIDGITANEQDRIRMNHDFTAGALAGYQVSNQLRTQNNSQQVLDNVLANRTIEFETASAALTPSGKAILTDMAKAITRIGVRQIELIGHTDNQGNTASNLVLSKSRAEAVKAFLVSQGVPAAGIRTDGKGASQPIASNTTEDGRMRNRRIAFRVIQ